MASKSGTTNRKPARLVTAEQILEFLLSTRVSRDFKYETPARVGTKGRGRSVTSIITNDGVKYKVTLVALRTKKTAKA